MDGDLVALQMLVLQDVGNSRQREPTVKVVWRDCSAKKERGRGCRRRGRRRRWEPRRSFRGRW
jgi:hypothetical protein